MTFDEAAQSGWWSFAVGFNAINISAAGASADVGVAHRMALHAEGPIRMTIATVPSAVALAAMEIEFFDGGGASIGERSVGFSASGDSVEFDFPSAGDYSAILSWSAASGTLPMGNTFYDSPTVRTDWTFAAIPEPASAGVATDLPGRGCPTWSSAPCHRARAIIRVKRRTAARQPSLCASPLPRESSDSCQC